MADTSGDEDYDRLRPLSYLDSDLILLCFSMDSAASMKNINMRWKAEMTHYLPEVPIVLVATKTDLEEEEEVEEDNNDVDTSTMERLASSSCHISRSVQEKNCHLKS